MLVDYVYFTGVFQGGVLAENTQASTGFAWGRAAMNIAVGMSPAVILTAAFLIAIERIAPVQIDGVALISILVACAVFSPLLSYLVSAPGFAALVQADSAEGRQDDAHQCATVRRTLPVLTPWMLLAAACLGWGLGHLLGWPTMPRVLLSINIALHLLLAAAMVAGFATRRPLMLTFTWLAYGAALLAAPALAWWLPPAAATVTHTLWLLVVARGTKAAPLPPASELFWALPNGFFEGTPIWLLGPTLWLLDPTTFLAGVYYPAMVPSLVGYQAFMFLMADALWRGVRTMNRTLAEVPYGTGRPVFRGFSRRAHQASLAVALGYPAIAAAGIWIAWLLSAYEPTTLIILASSASGALFAFSYLCTVIGNRIPLMVSSLALTVLSITALTLGVDDHVYLAGVGLLSLVLSAWAVTVALAAWRRPEYTLFWKKAMAL